MHVINLSRWPKCVENKAWALCTYYENEEKNFCSKHSFQSVLVFLFFFLAFKCSFETEIVFCIWKQLFFAWIGFVLTHVIHIHINLDYQTDKTSVKNQLKYMPIQVFNLLTSS